MPSKRFSFSLIILASFSACICGATAPSVFSRKTLRTLPRSDLAKIYGGDVNQICGNNFDCATTQVLCDDYGEMGCKAGAKAQVLTGQSANGCFYSCTGGELHGDEQDRLPHRLDLSMGR